MIEFFVGAVGRLADALRIIVQTFHAGINRAPEPVKRAGCVTIKLRHPAECVTRRCGCRFHQVMVESDSGDTISNSRQELDMMSPESRIESIEAGIRYGVPRIRKPRGSWMSGSPGLKKNRATFPVVHPTPYLDFFVVTTEIFPVNGLMI
jgi:hypothetical protein